MVSGIIAEFNIFHNGHKYLIDEARRNSDAVVAVMSGSFVQRGDIAIADKWSRAKTALMNGIDLVIELPVCYALNAAKNFAQGGAATLDALGIIDTLYFGSESGNINALTAAADALENEIPEAAAAVQEYMSGGLSYPAALEKAHSGKISGSILSMPNNILAVEYIRALKRLKSTIKPVTVKRHIAGHSSSAVSGNFASASKIRDMILNDEDITELIPYSIREITYPFLIDSLDCGVISRLRTMTSEELRNINEVSEGIENRILREANNTDGFYPLCEAVKTKRYTMSKVRRIVISSLIGFTKDIYSPLPQYVRVLGMNKKGAELIKNAKQSCSVPIITKTADYKEKSPIFELDVRATDIAMLCSPNKNERKGGADFTRSPIVIKAY